MWVTSLGLAGEAGIFASRPFYPMFSGVPNGPLRLSPPQVHAAVHNSGDIDQVPEFWPDNEIIRNDMLDYAFEIEHFDNHLARMLEALEVRGEIDNTLVVVTADNGMPFPRIKGQEYELSNHLPLAIMWEQGLESPGRVVDDFVSFIDFAPTFIELAGLEWDATGMQPTAGQKPDRHSLLIEIRASKPRARPRAHRQGTSRHRAAPRLGLSDTRDRQGRLALSAQLRTVALAGRQS